jgi:hypothetical protein
MFVLLVVSLFSAEPSLAPTVAGVPLRGPAETGRAAGFTAPVMGEGLTACPDTAPYECPGGCCTADYPYCCDDYCGSTPDACGGGGDSGGGGGGGGGCPGDYPYDCGDYCCAANFPYCCGDSTCGSTAECGGGGGGGSGGSGSGGGGGGGETCPADYPYLCDTYCCAAEYPYCCGDQICGATSACGGGGGGGGGGGCVDPYPADCGDGSCCPTEAPVCCGNGGCCPSGTVCLGDGQCGVSSDPSGGSCPVGAPLDCGNGYCCPGGTTCDVLDGTAVCVSAGGSSQPGGVSPGGGQPGGVSPGADFFDPRGKESREYCNIGGELDVTWGGAFALLLIHLRRRRRAA